MLGILLVCRPALKAALSLGIVTPRAPLVDYDPYWPPPSPVLDDDESSVGWTEGSSRMLWGRPRD